MQMSPAISMALSAIARASSSVLPASAWPRHGIRAARPDPDDPIVGLDQIAGARQQERGRLIENDEHRLQPAKNPIAPPVLRELDGGALQIAPILLQFRLEPGEEREGVGCRACEPCEDARRCRAVDLAGTAADDSLAEVKWPSPQYRAVAVADRKMVVMWNQFLNVRRKIRCQERDEGLHSAVTRGRAKVSPSIFGRYRGRPTVK